MQIGKFHLTRLREMVASEGLGLFPGLETPDLNDPRIVSAPFFDPVGDIFLTSIHLWVIRGEGKVILLDAGTGAGKNRPMSPRFHNLPGDLNRLLAPAGIGPEDVTDVVITHCHVDHIGWCTINGPQGPVPAFPGIPHHIPGANLDALAPSAAPAGRDPRWNNPWNDSIAPLLEAGLVRRIAPGAQIGPLEAIAADGHTPGQMAYRLRDGGQGVLFAADALHHPVQILNPDLNSRYCSDPETARATRRRLLTLAADEGLRLLPAHFDSDTGAEIFRAQEGGFDFR